ncbi:MAG: group II intron reverse transcriptase/maturase [Vulcanimicrobiota bacterium]
MKREESHQLLFAFADSPKGSKDDKPVGEPTGKSILQQIAKARKDEDSCTTKGPPEGLMEKVASRQNLASALLHVARNEGAPGPDGMTTEEILEAGHRLLEPLRSDLLAGRYRPGEIRRKEIPKPGGGSRNLGIPNCIDRWVQQAVHQILEPAFEPGFHPSSHGFRPDRGAQTAIAEAKQHLMSGCNYVVSIDLSRFFDEVNHQRLLARLARTIADKRVLRLIDQLLKAKVVLPDGTRVNTEKGTPQGGPLSPLLSNVVLDELDWELERRGLKFVRYADDFNAYVKSQRAGERVMASLTRFIEKRLRLKVNQDKSEVAPPEDIHFLGFSLKKGQQSHIVVGLSKRTLDRMRERIRELTPRTWGNRVSACFAKTNVYLKGWMGYFRLCTIESERILGNLDSHIRRRIRAIIITHKRTPRILYNHLRARGVKKASASKVAFTSCGTWRKSNMRGINLAYSNHWFVGKLTSLWGEWNRFNATPIVVPTQLTLEF